MLLRTALAIAFLAATTQAPPKDQAAKPCGNSCDGSTRELEECLSRQRDDARATLKKYLGEIHRLFGDQKDDMSALASAQKAWDEFVDADCKAHYQHFIDGSIRGVAMLDCQVARAEARTQELFDGYLRGTITELPDPAAKPRCN